MTSMRQSGFTLLELLVALAILSIMLSLVLGSLRFTATSSDLLENAVAANDDVFRVQSFLRRQLTQIRPDQHLMDQDDRDVSFAPDFVARADRLQFVAPFAAGVQQPGLFRMALTLETYEDADKSRKRLVLEYLPINDQENRAPARKILLTDLESAYWQYWGKQDRRPSRWADEWSNQAMIPSLIRLNISWDNSDARHWSEFIVTPRIAQSPRFDGQGG